METTKLVGIWIRVSTDFQVRDESPEIHEQRARYYIQTKGWEVGEVYQLDAVSGKTVMHHPETQRMLKDIRSGHIEGLVFSKLARLARNTKELLEFAEIFRKEKADLISLAEQIDTSSPAGRLFFTMISAIAEWEREEISSRVAASVPIRAKMGKSLGGTAIYGYKWENGTFQIDEKEAPIRKLAYEVFLKTQRRKTTATTLNNMGYRTRKGCKFTDTTIERMIRDPSAMGQRIANYTTGHNKKTILKPKEEWIIMPCPSIIDADLWEKCNQILRDQTPRKRVLGRTPVYLLSGYVKCECGVVMYARTTAKTFACKKCSNRITVEDMDELYKKYLKGYLSDVQPVHYLHEAGVLLTEKEHLLDVAEKERTIVRKQMDEFVKLRLEGELSKEYFAELIKPHELRLAQLNHSIPELFSEVNFRRMQVTSSDTVLSEAKTLYEEWEELPFEQKRGIVEMITEHIIIGKDDITISLQCLPSFEIDEKGNATRWF